MPEPCIQAPTILRIDEKLDRVMEALQVLAVQKNDIDHLSKDQESLRKWVITHEARLQKLELQPGKVAGKAVYLLSGGAITLIVGLALYSLTHAK